MNSVGKLSTWAGILLIVFLLAGCASKPVLTKEDSYSIISISPDGEYQETPIELTWNSNAAVMQELLLEASFVLSDLHTHMLDETRKMNNDADGVVDTETESAKIDSLAVKSLEKISNKKMNTVIPSSAEKVFKNEIKKENLPSKDMAKKSNDTIILKADFQSNKKFNLTIDNEQIELDVFSIQIEVEGTTPGRVVLNQVLTLQGIPNPNLKVAYEQYTEMLSKIKKRGESSK